MAPTPPATIAALLLERAAEDHLGLLAGEHSWTWTEVVVESAQRAALVADRRQPGPFHVGVLLDNVPEYVFWLGAAALSGATIVGINPTRRGPELHRDITHTDCQLIVTDRAGWPCSTVSTSRRCWSPTTTRTPRCSPNTAVLRSRSAPRPRRFRRGR